MRNTLIPRKSVDYIYKCYSCSSTEQYTYKDHFFVSQKNDIPYGVKCKLCKKIVSVRNIPGSIKNHLFSNSIWRIYDEDGSIRLIGPYNLVRIINGKYYICDYKGKINDNKKNISKGVSEELGLEIYRNEKKNKCCIIL